MWQEVGVTSPSFLSLPQGWPPMPSTQSRVLGRAPVTILPFPTASLSSQLLVLKTTRYSEGVS